MPVIFAEDTLLDDVPLNRTPAEQVDEDVSALDVLAASSRRASITKNLWDLAWEDEAPEAVPGYDPISDPQMDGYEQFYRRVFTSESPVETTRILQQVRDEISDNKILQRAGGWGIASSIASGVTDPFTVASMAIPVAPALVGAGRAARVAAGVGAQIAFDTAAEGVFHARQETRTGAESALNIGAGALLVGALGTLVTRVPKKELDEAIASLNKELHGKPLTDISPTGESTVGASAVGTGTTLADEGIATAAGRFIAKTLGRASIVTRLLGAPAKTARILAGKLSEVPFLQGKHLKGITSEDSVDTLIKKIVHLGRYQATTKMDEAFLAYKKSGGELTRKQFSTEVSAALSRGDESLISQVGGVVQWARKQFSEDARLLRELGVDIAETPLGAKSYFPRVYDVPKILSQQTDFEARLFKWFKEHPKNPDKPLEDAEIWDAARQTVETILGMPSGKAHVASGIADPLKARVLDVPDDILRPYLVQDFERVMSGYFRSMAPEITLRQKFGSTDLKQQFDEVIDEFRRLQAAAKSDKAKAALNEQQAKVINDLTHLRDRLLGNVGPTNGSTYGRYKNWVRAARVARIYNYTRTLGGQMLSSMSDYGKLVARYGLPRTMRATGKFLTNWSANKLARADAHRMGTALEMVVDTRAHQIGDIADELPITRLEQGMEWAGNKFSRISLMSPWNATIKHLASILEQDSLLRAVKGGKLSTVQKANLARYGFDEAELKKVGEQFAKHGEDLDGLFRARTELWDDQALAQKVENAIMKVGDEIMIIKGVGDLPAMMDQELVKTVLQFKTFAISSVNRTMIPLAQGLAMGDAKTAQGVLTMMTLGMTIYYLKEFAAGREPDTSPSRLVAEAFNWSGMMGYLPELWDPVASLSPEDEEGKSILPRFSRFKSRSPMESWLGPTFGTTSTLLAGAASTWADGNLEQKDVQMLRRLMPLQNLFYTRRLFNAIEGETGEAIGAEGATNEDFFERAVGTEPTR